jgi:predicted acyltransferase
MKRVSGIGLTLLAVGLVVAIWLPLNKRVWSTSYVLVTCGIATLVLIVLTYIADHHGKWAWFDLFRRAGLHAFFIYVASEMLAPVIGHYDLNEAIHGYLCHVFSPEMSSFIYSMMLSFLLLCYGYIPKDKKK